MDPTREPQFSEPAAPRDTLPDDAVVAYLRARAPGLPTPRFDARAVTSRARGALRRRRLRNSVMALASAATAHLTLALASPLPVPGVGTVTLPGSQTIQAVARHLFPDGHPGLDQRQADVGRIETHVLPVVEDLGLTRYINQPGRFGGSSCRVLTWSHGAFQDRNSDCVSPDDPTPHFDAESEAAFARVADAVEASGVDVYRIEKGGWGPGISFHLNDSSWQWNWYYSYIPDTPADAPEEIRTETKLGTRLQVHVTGNWWFTTEPDD